MKIKRMMAALVAAFAFSALPALATTTNFTSASSVSFSTTQPASTDAVTVSITSTSSSGSCTFIVNNPAGQESSTTWSPATVGTTTTIYVGAAGVWSITSSGCTITGSASYT